MKKFIISNIFSKILPKQAEKKEQSGMHARRDWVILLFIFVFLNAIVVIFSTYLYIQINKGTIFVVESSAVETVETFDQAELDKILLFYGKKEREFEKLKTDVSSIPSVR